MKLDGEWAEAFARAVINLEGSGGLVAMLLLLLKFYFP